MFWCEHQRVLESIQHFNIAFILDHVPPAWADHHGGLALYIYSNQNNFCCDSESFCTILHFSVTPPKSKNDDTTFGYMMAAQQLEATMTEAQKDSENPEVEDLELVETPPMAPTEEHDKK